MAPVCWPAAGVKESMGFNLNAVRSVRASHDTTKECHDSMQAICMKEKHPDEVECCRCGQRTLILKRQGNAANPWATVECTYVYSDGVPCGFQHTCGHAEPPPPKLIPKI